MCDKHDEWMKSTQSMIDNLKKIGDSSSTEDEKIDQRLTAMQDYAFKKVYLERKSSSNRTLLFSLTKKSPGPNRSA